MFEQISTHLARPGSFPVTQQRPHNEHWIRYTDIMTLNAYNMIPVTNLVFVLIRPKHDRHEYKYSVSPARLTFPRNPRPSHRGIMSDSAVSAGAPTLAGGGCLGWPASFRPRVSVSRDPAPPSHRCLCHECHHGVSLPPVT